ncbi:hypothetical protein HYU11_06440 [Candidatus Woesearchaeota archaeon]|nr:hypothetical protein [Candidatus Woesearchaeota archaeon]
MLTGSFAMILIFPYSYLIGCIIANGVDMIKHKKLLLAITASVFILIAGLDEPLMNNTINKPDYSCITDNDCTEKLIHKVQCGRYQCVNSKWEYYDSMINRAFATSCRNTPYSCSCVENKCQTIEKDQMPE